MIAGQVGTKYSDIENRIAENTRNREVSESKPNRERGKNLLILVKMIPKKTKNANKVSVKNNKRVETVARQTDITF